MFLKGMAVGILIFCVYFYRIFVNFVIMVSIKLRS
jgi:hypothetical protein